MSVEVACIGEILADVIPLSTGPYRDGIRLELHFGGAPANVAVGVARLGHRARFVGAVGDDPIGDMLREFLANNGVDTRWLVRKRARTSLAFVILREGGERDFLFYRRPWVETADTMLEPGDIDLEQALDAEVVHASGVAAAYPPLSTTVYTALSKAFAKGVFVSVDPNYRGDIWGSGTEALNAMDRLLRVSHMVTMGMDEVVNMFGGGDVKAVAKALLSRYENLEIVAVRLGARGAYVAKRGGEEVYAPAFRITPVDTTGAGDAWTATFIVMHILEGKSLMSSVVYSNAAAAIKCTRVGAASAFPHRAEVEEFVRRFAVGYADGG